MTTAMTIRECWNAGYDHGWGLATYNPMPEIGTLNNVNGPMRVETVEDQIEAWMLDLSAADEHSRQFTPFEFTAAAINARDERYGEGATEDGWSAFDRGQERAISDYRRKHYPIPALRKAAKESETNV